MESGTEIKGKKTCDYILSEELIFHSVDHNYSSLLLQMLHSIYILQYFYKQE